MLSSLSLDDRLVDCEAFAGCGVEHGARCGGPPLDLPSTVRRHRLDAAARPYDARAAAVLVPFGVEFTNHNLIWRGGQWNRPLRRRPPATPAPPAPAGWL